MSRAQAQRRHNELARVRRQVIKEKQRETEAIADAATEKLSRKLLRLRHRPIKLSERGPLPTELGDSSWGCPRPLSSTEEQRFATLAACDSLSSAELMELHVLKTLQREHARGHSSYCLFYKQGEAGLLLEDDHFQLVSRWTKMQTASATHGQKSAPQDRVASCH